MYCSKIITINSHCFVSAPTVLLAAKCCYGRQVNKRQAAANADALLSTVSEKWYLKKMCKAFGIFVSSTSAILVDERRVFWVFWNTSPFYVVSSHFTSYLAQIIAGSWVRSSFIAPEVCVLVMLQRWWKKCWKTWVVKGLNLHWWHFYHVPYLLDC